MSKINKKIFFINSVWKSLEIISTKGVSMIISIILARLLLPEDYGIVALTAVFINLAGIFVSSGLETSLIQKKDVDDLDFSSAFFFSLFVAGIVYLIFFVAAPYIADYYKKEVLTPILRVQMLSLFIGAFSIVRNAIIIRQFQFKKLCIINTLATVIGGITGISLAYFGFGVWALIFYTMIRDAVSTGVLLIAVKWNIIFKVSSDRLRKLISYSVWVLLTSLVDFVGNNIYGVVYGKKYSMTELGYYNKGGQLPELFGQQTFGAITSVLFPALAESQNDTSVMRSIVRKVVKMSSYFIFPMMAGLAVIGERVVTLLYTEKWLPCVPILWVSCMYCAINPLRAINMQIVYASGNSKKATMIEVIRCVLLSVNLIVGSILFKLDMYTLTFSTLSVAVIVALLTQIYANKMIGYSFVDWIKDFTPAMGLSLLMAAIVYTVGQFRWNYKIVLLMQIAVGVCVYVLLSVLIGMEPFRDIIQMVKGVKRNDASVDDI